MRENLIHVNSRNEVLDFKKLGTLVNYNELRDYEWSYSSENNVITGFTKGIVKKTIPFVFFTNEDKADEIKNKFYEHFDVDVLSEEPGYFKIGDYKYYCYLTKSKKTNYLIDKRYLELSVEVTTDIAEWINEKTLNLIMYSDKKSHSREKKYTYSYPYIYSNQKGVVQVNNDSFISCDFILRIYGPCSNPFVKIGQVIYQVNSTLTNDEYLEINTKERTIFAYSKYGEKRDLFHFRGKERSNFFEKFPSGTSTVAWNGMFKAELIIYETRGEPKWI